MTLRSIIVSAGHQPVSEIQGMLANMANVDLVTTTADGSAALRAIAANKIDVVFLDAEMPHADTLGFGDLAGQAVSMPYLVLVAGHERQASKAFDLGATDFLTRPVRQARLETAIARVTRAKRQSEAEAHFERLDQRLRSLSAEYSSRPNNDIWVQRRGDRIRIDLHRVNRLEAEGEYVRLFIDGADYLHRDSLTAMMARIDPQRMVRIHRSFAVQRDEIAAIRRLSTGSYQVILADGKKLPIGRTYRSEVRAIPQRAER